MPGSIFIPYRNLAIPARLVALHPSKAEELGPVIFSLSPFQRDSALVPIQFLIYVASPSFNVVDQNTDAVNALIGRQRDPVESDTGCVRQYDSRDIWGFRTPPRTTTAILVGRFPKRGRCLHDRG